jgi:hypothetical protein
MRKTPTESTTSTRNEDPKRGLRVNASSIVICGPPLFVSVLGCDDAWTDVIPE